MQGSGPTLADLLQSLPDHSYTEGESIFADLAMTLVSQHCSIRCDRKFISAQHVALRPIRLTEVDASIGFFVFKYSCKRITSMCFRQEV